MVAPLNLLNKQFGRLFVTERAISDKHGNSRWKAVCKCGNEGVYTGTKLLRGVVKSCGCLAVDACVSRSTKHGHSSRKGRSREYNAWLDMKTRCCNKQSKSYPRYGAKGVTVCAEWVNSFETFLADVGNCPDGYKLDRIDNAKRYEPSNARWASETAQSRNRSYCLGVDKVREIKKDTRSSRVIAKEYGVEKSTILAIKRGETWKGV